jgi:hydroxymethylpyrimidine pyrophosphatase-like HAD family hydrolase
VCDCRDDGVTADPRAVTGAPQAEGHAEFTLAAWRCRRRPRPSKTVRYQVLATDYDGTIAAGGHVDNRTRAALRLVRSSGRRILLVTGRDVPSVARVFDELALFDLVVAENGAVVHDPATGETTVLCPPPPPALLGELERRRIDGLCVGEAVVAAHARAAAVIADVVRDLGLEMPLSFNRDAVMVLPPGVNKGTGFLHALGRLRIDPSASIAIGDAENDHPLLAVSGHGVAVANAVPALQARADVVTREACGAGVVETVEWLLAADAAAEPIAPRPRPPAGL